MLHLLICLKTDTQNKKGSDLLCSVCLLVHTSKRAIDDTAVETLSICISWLPRPIRGGATEVALQRTAQHPRRGTFACQDYPNWCHQPSWLLHCVYLLEFEINVTEAFDKTHLQIQKFGLATPSGSWQLKIFSKDDKPFSIPPSRTRRCGCQTIFQISNFTGHSKPNTRHLVSCLSRLAYA